ncbi:hypothetical protein Q669_26500 [Labrenzia sp. C1B10]|nr:hypothetical protein Q669_26500 [Labrenzia sp. C1B10]ERS04423.1 hypothetical protein Q675_29840 [Labrenzia sp. C1B70]
MQSVEAAIGSFREDGWLPDAGSVDNATEGDADLPPQHTIARYHQRNQKQNVPSL